MKNDHFCSARVMPAGTACGQLATNYHMPSEQWLCDGHLRLATNDAVVDASRLIDLVKLLLTCVICGATGTAPGGRECACRTTARNVVQAMSTVDVVLPDETPAPAGA